MPFGINDGAIGLVKQDDILMHGPVVKETSWVAPMQVVEPSDIDAKGEIISSTKCNY